MGTPKNQPPSMQSISSSTAQGGGSSFQNRKPKGKANPLMDQKVVGVVHFEMVAVAAGCTTAGCSVVKLEFELELECSVA